MLVVVVTLALFVVWGLFFARFAQKMFSRVPKDAGLPVVLGAFFGFVSVFVAGNLAIIAATAYAFSQMGLLS